MPRRKWNTPAAFAQAILASDTAAVSQAITQLESTRADHQEAAQALLALLLPHTGQSLRIGITGTPGVGKSTFIEAFGLHLIQCGHRVAVVAVDPSSEKSGGSILGDKTRMERLSQHPHAFIRPTPAGKNLGGVAHATREATLVLEAAGYDRILIETVGVGQSEAVVRTLVDAFVLLVQPGGGDDLQGIKRGILELADILVVTKNDGQLKKAAAAALADYSHARKLVAPHYSGWRVPTLAVSSLEETGFDTLAAALNELEAYLRSSDRWDAQRAEQRRIWFDQLIEAGLKRWFAARAGAKQQQARSAVSSGHQTPYAAAKALLDELLPDHDTTK